MKLQLALLALVTTGWGACHAAPVPTNSPSLNRLLLIHPSSMPVAGGTATLTIGPLRRTDGVYTGDYDLTVSPYFFKSEKGRLAIVVPDASLAAINDGNVTPVIGTATTIGRSGRSRHIDAVARPVDINHGSLKLWFMAGDRKMVFEPLYHLSGKPVAASPDQPAKAVAGAGPTASPQPSAK